MKLEDAPNKQVHAEDLAEALAKLHHRSQHQDLPPSPLSDVEMAGTSRGRSGSSTTIYMPEDDRGLPAVTVEDCGDFEDRELEMPGKAILAHTARPPVELMQN